MMWRISSCDANLGWVGKSDFAASMDPDATSTNMADCSAFVQNVADRSPDVGTLGIDWKAIALLLEDRGGVNTS